MHCQVEAMQSERQVRENWETKTRVMRDKIEVNHDYSPLTGRKKKPLLLGMPRRPRFMDLLNVSEAYKLKAGRTQHRFISDTQLVF